MSLCQPESTNGKPTQVSCGSCCGLFNLDLETKGFKKLLLERTEEFNKTVDFSISHTMPAYRQSREKIEKNIPKKDETTYNCPFLGYLDPSISKIGCMIHPIRTGNPKSQNYSFYGSSICLAYECKNKENPNATFWEEIFSEVSIDSVEYSQLSANHPLVRRIETAYGRENLFQSKQEIIEILNQFIKQGNLKSNLTSFEVDYEGKESPKDCEKWLDDFRGN